ncbi:MAG TPA: hypothetical protein PLJ21_11155 [Pseudobdellovibrionaceae bacterium]|nr:hypothetical protein [Pseudobdellovibrionaceae bacterium]
MISLKAGFKKVSLVLLIISTTSFALAADRVSMVNSKIVNAISGILPASDYLVIVNRLDMMEDGGDTEAVTDGTLKALPGLTVGVDSKGNVVRQDALGNHYNGPVSIAVLLDRNVNAETVKTIKNSINEIIGGARELDEVKISQATLRQPPIQATSPVTVNNMPPSSSQNNMQDHFKLAALLLMVAGLFAFLIGRVIPKNNAGQNAPRSSNNRSPESSPEEKKENFKQDNFADQISKIEPQVVGLYLMKALKDKKMDHVAQWGHSSSASHQRDVFLSLPAWIAAYIENSIDRDNATVLDTLEVKPEQLLREITVIETNLKSDFFRAEAFLMWFPAQSLRMVPKKYQASFSSKSRSTLWHYRKELGEFVKAQVMSADQIMVEPSSEEVQICFDEMRKWPSSLYVQDQKQSHDAVTLWSDIINQLTEFSAIDGQLKQAEAHLSKEDYKKLLLQICYVESPMMWTPELVKSWLLIVDPNDYLWWSSLVQYQPQWNFSELLRPMRRAMFEFALQNPSYKTWNEQERKTSSERILAQMRHVQLGFSVETLELSAA